MSDSSDRANTREHPFARFVRALGKGKTGSRSLSQVEAEQAFAMILRSEAEPVQIGAFLMLLRVKEETGEELAGFVQACRSNMLQPQAPVEADLDWSSYAGKKHQHPWFILSMLLLAQAGYRVFVHGAGGHTAGRLYTEDAMRQLGLAVAADWQEVCAQLERDNISYLPLRCFCPQLYELIQLKPLLGLRSPVNTLTRMLNPLRAQCSIQSIFHPAYAVLHQDADRLLGQPRALVFRGDSGEVEVKPQADTRLQLLAGSLREEYLVPRVLQQRVPAIDRPSVEPLRALWRGSLQEDYARHAVLGTTAAALWLLRSDLDLPAAQEQAGLLWRQRDITRLD